MRSANDYTTKHDKARDEREEFRAKHPDKYKIIPFGQSTEAENFMERIKKHGKPANQIQLNDKKRGDVYKKYRLDAGLTQVELAKKCGKSSKWVSRIECGRIRDAMSLALFKGHCNE